MLFWAACAASAQTSTAKILFDPSRHMRVSEVKPGMQGYGLSVFRGTKIQRFDVEVIDVVKNFNPTFDAILVRCKGEYLNHTGSIEGMSGSPIYLFDSTGKARMCGAFAYGWPFAKDCVGGVQPIEYMLNLPIGGNDSSNSSASATPGQPPAQQTSRPRWSLEDVVMPGKPKPEGANNLDIPARLNGMDMHLQPLATPLLAGGISARALSNVAPLFAGTGLSLMQAGGGGAEMNPAAPPPKLEPGSVLAVPLLTGDLELTAVGTCTEVIGDRMFGFGHHYADEPSHGEGLTTLPMGSGSVALVVANLAASFKLGFLSQPMGTLTTDHIVGVAGRIGMQAPMAPMEMHVVYDDGSVDRVYHFKSALDAKLTPLIAAVAINSALYAEKDLPQYHTLSYVMNVDFAGGRSIRLANTSVNAGFADIMNDVVMPIAAAMDNPFKRVPLAGIRGTVHVSGIARSAQIVSVMIPRSKFAPGETLKAYVEYRPFHAEESTLPIELKLPSDLPNGTYQLRVSDWVHYLEDEKATNPFKFTAQNIDELFAVLKDVTSIRHDAVYLRLVRQADGVAVGRTAMPRLPSAARDVLLGSGRTDITRFVSSTIKIAPSDLVMNGQADFSITIERHGKVEVAAPAASN
jgi:hypothetical protein